MESDTPHAAGRHTAPATPLRVIAVGSIVPDEPQYRTAAFSRAGNRAFGALVQAVAADPRVRVQAVLSFIPVPAFPRGPIWFSRPTVRCVVGPLTNVRLMPFLNVNPVKSLTLGLAAFWQIVCRFALHPRSPRVVVCYNLSAPPGIFSFAAARITGAKIVGMIYDIEIPGETVPRTAWRRLDYAMQRFLLRRLDGTAVITDAIARDFGVRHPHLRLDGAVTEELLNLTSPDASRGDHAGGSITLVAVGSLDEANGFRLIAEAMSLLQRRDIDLLIAGDGPLRSFVEDLAARDSRVRYLGYVSTAEVYALYRRATAILCVRLVSLVRTPYCFPSKVIEAIGTGVPVISTAPAHFREEYGRFVTIIETDSGRAVAEAIESVLAAAPQHLRSRALAGRQYVSSQKRWEKVGKRFVDYCLTVLSGR
jgi:glycosyltransferase involved in cell wall biosynthesis